MAPSLEELASRLAALIDNHPDLLAVLDYTAGALLCLREAERCGYRDRPGPCDPDYREQVAAAVREMQAGNMPRADFWIAGWHFNSALVRIVASYDRGRGALTRRNRRQGDPSRTIVVHTHGKIDKIRAEVDTLKHVPEANTPGRHVQFDEALGGFGELLDFIDQSTA